ncbi:MAG: lysylphosphatidylglycerol synthase domain-containing protein [Planctomycetota bacterium]|nr:lysylphosphatidylglycerol synthase domain-containing protein [Planctomycetota bacterium]
MSAPGTPPGAAPGGVVREAERLSRARGPLRLAVQIVGMLVALGLLAWCVRLALAPANRASIRRLSEAPTELVAALFALALAGLVLNGLGFAITLRRLARVRLLDVQATNAIATALAYLPFKLSIVARVMYHHRRDGVPLMRIGAWLGANATIILAVVVPLGAAGLWRGGLDGAYIAASAGGLIACVGGAHFVALAFGGEAGLARLAALARRARLGFVERLLARPSIRDLHAGLAIIAHRPTLLAAAGVRVADVLVQALRFIVVGRALGIPLPFEKAVLASSTFFLTGAASPAGSVGAREGATTGVGALVQIPGVPYESLSVIALAVSAAEIVLYVPLGVAAFLYLRVRRPLVPYDPADASGPHPAEPDGRRTAIK